MLHAVRAVLPAPPSVAVRPVHSRSPRRRRQLAVAALLLTAAFPTGPVAAQEPVELEGLVVTVNRWAQPDWTAASHVTVLEGEDLERAGVRFVADALRRAPGLAAARNGSFGAVTSVFLRGGESDHLLVLVDGVRVNEPGGRFDFGALSADNVERIEIVRGPGSALYGSGAVSGVVHVFTRRGTGEPKAGASFGGGSFGARRWLGHLAGGTGALSYAFSAGQTDTDGILAFNNAFRRTTVTGRVHGRAGPRTDATMSFRYEDRRFHYPTDGTGAVVDRNAYTFGDALLVSVDAGQRWTDAIETRVTLSLHDTDGGTDDASDGPADTLGFYGFRSLDDVRRTSADARAVWRPGRGSTVLAVGWELEQQTIRDFNQSLSQYGASSGSTDNERWNRATYAQAAWDRGGVALNGGARVEDNERYGVAYTWRAGAVWRASRRSGTRLRASAGTGIKAPSFTEVYATGFVTGNPDLKPERSTGVEAGLDHELAGGKVRVSATAFRHSYRDLIQYTSSPPVAGGPNYYNAAKASSRGVEAEAAVNTGRFAFTGSYTWTDAKVVEVGFADEGPLLRRPAHTVAATAFARVADRMTLDASARRVGERADLDFSTWPAAPVTLPAYLVLDLSVDFELTAASAGRPGVALTVRADNLLDEEYQEAWGFRAPGRALYVGGRVSLGGGG